MNEKGRDGILSSVKYCSFLISPLSLSSFLSLSSLSLLSPSLLF